MSVTCSHSGFNTFLWGVVATLFLAFILWMVGSGVDFATGGHMTSFAKFLAPKISMSLDKVVAAAVLLLALAIMLLALLVEHRAKKRALAGNV